MKTALLLSSSADVHRQLAELLKPQRNILLIPPPAEPAREQFDLLFKTWKRVIDGVILDAASLGETSRWAIESLRDANLDPHQAVVVRATAMQASLYPMDPSWMVISDDLKELKNLATFLDLRDTQAKLRRAQTAEESKPVAATVWPEPPANSSRYREALKSLSRVLSQRHDDERSLIGELARLLRDLIGTGRLAIFVRRHDAGFLEQAAAPFDAQFEALASIGVAPQILEHLRLSLAGGIAGYLQSEAKVLRRTQPDLRDEQIAREFELLGMEYAVPMFDNAELLGVLAFGGRITGEPISSDDLEFIYGLMTQLGQGMRNLQLVRRLASQQRLLSEVLTHVVSGVLVVDQREKILAANDRLRSLLELDSTPLVGKELARIPGRVADVVYEVMAGTEACLDREITLPRNNRALRVRATRFEQAETRQRTVVALVEDLTQEKLRLAHQREMADREFLMRLAFRLSHELKNSLVSIKIFAQLLPERYSEKDFRDQFSGTVVNEVNRVDVLVNNLTFFSHPLVLVYDEVVLSDLLESCAKNIAAEFSRKQLAQLVAVGDKSAETTPGVPVVTLKKSFAHKLARLEGDKLRLMQAFEHILRNAMQAMPAGGRLSVNTGDAEAADFPDGRLPAGGAVKIQFQDTGEGISLENLPHVAEPFVTTRNVGVGLGLTIVKKIAERHSGRMEVDSMLGRGTTVTLLLPAKAQPHPEDAILKELGRTGETAMGTGEPDAVGRLPKPIAR